MGDLFDESVCFDLFEDRCDDKMSAAPVDQTVESKAVKSRTKRFVTRRASSEEQFYRIMDWHIEAGCVYNIITNGDIDFLTFIRSILKQQKAKYLLISTWCMGNDDADEILEWVKKGLIKRLDVYTGELIQSYMHAAEQCIEATGMTGGRLAMFRNHAKIAVVYGEKFNCAISSSANVNCNPRTEQTVIQADREVCAFYKDYFDHIYAFNKDDQPKDWRPWNDAE